VGSVPKGAEFGEAFGGGGEGDPGGQGGGGMSFDYGAQAKASEKAIRFFIEEVDSKGKARKAYFLCEKCKAVIGDHGATLGFNFCPWCGVPLAVGFVRETRVIGG
jgi:rRNA maturation endonuclease Nob1